MALNFGSRAGWIRLWIVASVLWGLTVVANVVHQYPTRAELEAKQAHQLSITSPETEARNTEQRKRRNLPPMPHEEWERMRQEAHEHFQNQFATLADRQRHLLIVSSLTWLLPCAGLYLIGWLIGWILRGFRSPT